MTKPDPIEVLTERALARARLWAEGYLDFHEAVDRLQFDAVNLAAEIGQDAVQLIISEAFAKHRVRTEEPAPRLDLQDIEGPPRTKLAGSTISAVRHILLYGDVDTMRRFIDAHGEPDRGLIIELLKHHRQRKQKT